MWGFLSKWCMLSVSYGCWDTVNCLKMVGNCYCPIVIASHPFPSPYLYLIQIPLKWMSFLYISCALDSRVRKLGFSWQWKRVPIYLACLNSLAIEKQPPSLFSNQFRSSVNAMNSFCKMVANQRNEWGMVTYRMNSLSLNSWCKLNMSCKLEGKLSPQKQWTRKREWNSILLRW